MVYVGHVHMTMSLGQHIFSNQGKPHEGLQSVIICPLG